MKYPHSITVSHAAQVSDGGGGYTKGTVTTVYSGAADVQDGSEAMRQVADAGLEGRGDAVVFLPESTSISASGILEGHDFTWGDTSQSGKVVGIRHLDDSFMVSYE